MPFQFDIDGYMKVRPSFLRRVPATGCPLLSSLASTGEAAFVRPWLLYSGSSESCFLHDQPACKCRSSGLHATSSSPHPVPAVPYLQHHYPITHPIYISSTSLHGIPTPSPIAGGIMSNQPPSPGTRPRSRRELELIYHELLQRQQEVISENIRITDTSGLAPGLSETDLIQQLVSVVRP